MSASPRRIVCLTEETTELLYLLGEEARIVGISAYTVRPPEAARDKPKVSAFIKGNIRRIRALEPDLVIGFSDIQAQLAAELIQAGLNVLVLNQRSLEEIFAAMLLVARLVDRGREGEGLVAGWRSALDQARAAAQGRPRPRVFFQEWDDPIICGIRWVSELIEIVGGDDCFADRRGALAKDRIVTADEVAAARPDAIIGSWCGKPVDFAWVRGKPEWQNTAALARNAVYEIDSSIILQPGPALFTDGIAALTRCVAAARDAMG